MKTTIYISLSIGAQQPAFPAYVAFMSPYRFVSGSTVVLPEPSPVALGSDGTATISVDPGVWIVDEILPTGVRRRAVAVPEAAGVIPYAELQEVSSPPDLGYGPTWAATAERSAAQALTAIDAAQQAITDANNTITRAQAAFDALPVTSDANMLAAANLPNSVFMAKMRDEFALAGEIVFNVQRYGAKGDGTTDDTEAIQRAINDACALVSNRFGATVFFPGSYSSYRATQLFIRNNRETQITLRGAGNAMLRPIASADNLGPFLDISPVDAPSGIGTGYMRHVAIETLKISGSGNVYADSRIAGNPDAYASHRKRVGIRVTAIQDFRMVDCYLTHFAVGLRTHDMFDSKLDNVQILHCGYSYNDDETVIPGTTSPIPLPFTSGALENFTTGYGYALELGEYLDHSNANKFVNLHFEGGPLFVWFKDGSRQNQFITSKFENRTPAEDDLSTKSAFWAQEAGENTFTGCMFTENYTRPKHVVRGEFLDTPYSLPQTPGNLNNKNVKQVLAFSNCTFAGNSTTNAKWFTGSNLLASLSTFNRCDGSAGDSLYPFILQNDCSIVNCRITFADEGIRFVRLNGARNRVRDNNLIGQTAVASVAALYFLALAAANNTTADNETVGNFSTLISSAKTNPNGDYDTNVFTRSTALTKTVSTGETPNVLLADIIVLTHSAATSITNFTAGHYGKRIVVRGGSTAAALTLVHNINVMHLKGGTNRVLGQREAIQLINDAGVWREI